MGSDEAMREFQEHWRRAKAQYEAQMHNARDAARRGVASARNARDRVKARTRGRSEGCKPPDRRSLHTAARTQRAAGHLKWLLRRR